MQMIIAYDGGPEDYAGRDAQFEVARPKSCPNCRKSAGMRALGYYSRWVSSFSKQKVTQISIRRFRCPSCHRTTSMLPDFAQTYRLVETDTVDRFLSGSRSGEGVDVWAGLLGGYQKRFECRLPETRCVLSGAFGLRELPRPAVEVWEELCRFFGGARKIAERLTTEVGITVFGLYQCHQPFRAVPVHTSAIFTWPRSPPIVPVRHASDPKSNARL